MRPELHRYCARMLGSTLDGEDAVQDALLRAHKALLTGTRPSELRFWLFRLAHNCSVDLLRKRRPEVAVDMTYLSDIPEVKADTALEIAMQKQSTQAAVSTFLHLPAVQRSTVILKDVLGYELTEIGRTLDMPITAVKAALHRGRSRLMELAATPRDQKLPLISSPELQRFVRFFNERNWDGLTAMLSEDVHLLQTTRAERRGRQQVASTFFRGYEAARDWRLEPARVDGKECAAVFLIDEPSWPAYFMLLDWQNGVLASIRDFRYARYVMDGAWITR